MPIVQSNRFIPGDRIIRTGESTGRIIRGNVYTDADYYELVSIKPNVPATYKIGDKIRVVRNSTGIGTQYIGKEYTVVNTDGLKQARQYIGCESGVGHDPLYIYIRDIELAKPRIDTSTFKGFMKSKALANVASS